MTDEEALEKYDLLKEYFKDDLPNPEQEPIRFAYYVKLYKFYMERFNESSQHHTGDSDTR
jgi:hypothetical protein